VELDVFLKAFNSNTYWSKISKKLKKIKKLTGLKELSVLAEIRNRK